MILVVPGTSDFDSAPREMPKILFYGNCFEGRCRKITEFTLLQAAANSGYKLESAFFRTVYQRFVYSKIFRLNNFIILHDKKTCSTFALLLSVMSC